MPFEHSNDTNKQILKEIWGNNLEKLTPKQRQLIVEIFTNVDRLWLNHSNDLGGGGRVDIGKIVDWNLVKLAF